MCADFKTVVRIPSQLCGLSADQKASFRAKNIENRSHWAENAEISLLSIRTTGLKSARQAKNPHVSPKIRTSCQKSARIIQNPHAPSEIRTANPKSARHNKKNPAGKFLRECYVQSRSAETCKLRNFASRSTIHRPAEASLRQSTGPTLRSSRPTKPTRRFTVVAYDAEVLRSGRPAKPTCKTDLQNRPAKPISRNVRKRNVRLPRSADC